MAQASWRSLATWRCSTFIIWAVCYLAMTVTWWQHYKQSLLSLLLLLLLPRPRRVLFLGDFFVSLFLSATLRENGWTDLHEIFREGVEWPWDDLIKFWVNLGKPVGGSKVNLLSPAIAQSQLHSLGGSRGGCVVPCTTACLLLQLSLSNSA